MSAPYSVVGRYAIFDEIAAGGMATVHIGKLLGAGGFSRLVAIKRLHPQFAKDAEFSAMFMDEARLAARIHHPNVVQTLDVVALDKDLLLVMEYVHGMSFASLLGAARRSGQRVDPRIAAAVVAGALEGLHAAHEAKSETGEPLGVVHRDISPQNILVGAEGTARILDFGIAKAVGKMHATREGQLKGKLAYMSPEQVRSAEVTRQSDIFSTAIVLWEALMGQRLFDGQNPAELIMQVLNDRIDPPASRFPDVPPALDAVVMKGLARDTADRYATARDMVVELEAAVPLAPPREIARWVESLSGETLGARRQRLDTIERLSLDAAVSAPPERQAVESGMRAKPQGSPAAAGQAQTMRSASPDEPQEVDLSAPAPSTTPRDRAPAPAPLPVAPAAPQGLGSYPPRPNVDPLGEPAGVLPAGPRPVLDPMDRGFGAGLEAARANPRPRPHRIHVELDEPEPISLRERLETPLKVVAAGVVISLIDMAVRPYTASLPFRPLWAAEILVVAGVIWALVRLVVPPKSSRD